jgi:hypothetical protein
MKSEFWRGKIVSIVWNSGVIAKTPFDPLPAK